MSNGGIMKYKKLIFDLDGTLVSDRESMKYAFCCVLKELGIAPSMDLALEWLKFDDAYWHEIESGRTVFPEYVQTKEDRRVYAQAMRFVLFFESFSISFEQAIHFNDVYCENLGMNIVPILGAEEVLCFLKENYEIYIATNGPRRSALKKLENANLSSYISGVLSSEDAGITKPSKIFFDSLFQMMQYPHKEEALMIGDGITTDILGGMQYGIDTCLFNPNNNQIPIDCKPTMSVQSLLELKRKL